MVAAALDIERSQVEHDTEALGQAGAVEALARVFDVRPRHLKEHTPKLVVDLLVVLILPLTAKAAENRPQAQFRNQPWVAESDVQRHRER